MQHENKQITMTFKADIITMCEVIDNRFVMAYTSVASAIVIRKAPFVLMVYGASVGAVQSFKRENLKHISLMREAL